LRRTSINASERTKIAPRAAKSSPEPQIHDRCAATRWSARGRHFGSDELAVHESMATNVQKRIERRSDFSDASVDPTEAR
jgi:hypothetical protein